MSPFRDDQEAALARADALEDELERQKAENERLREEKKQLEQHKVENEHLRKKLGAASKKELASAEKERLREKQKEEERRLATEFPTLTEKQRRQIVEAEGRSEEHLERARALGMIGPDGELKPNFWGLMRLGRPGQPRFVKISAYCALVLFAGITVWLVVRMFV